MGKQSRRRREFSDNPFDYSSNPGGAGGAGFQAQYDDRDFEFSESNHEDPMGFPEERNTPSNMKFWYKLAGAFAESYVDAVKNQYAANAGKPAASLFAEREQKKDPYDVLEIPRGSDMVVVKRQFRKLALMYHPDRQSGISNADAKRDAELKMKEINEAYQQLRVDTGDVDDDHATGERSEFPSDSFQGNKRRPKSGQNFQSAAEEAERKEQERLDKEMSKKLKKQADEEMAQFKAEVERIKRESKGKSKASLASSELGASTESLHDVFEKSTSSLAIAVRLNIITVLISLVSRDNGVPIDLPLDECNNNVLHYCVYYDRTVMVEAILTIMRSQWSILVCSKNKPGKYPSDIIPKVPVVTVPTPPEEPTSENKKDEVTRPAPVGFLAQRLRELEKSHTVQKVEYQWYKVIVDIIAAILLTLAMKVSEFTWGTHFYDSKRILAVGILCILPLFRQLPFIGICAIVSSVVFIVTLSWFSLFLSAVSIAAALVVYWFGGARLRYYISNAGYVVLTVIYIFGIGLQYPYKFFNENYIRPVLNEMRPEFEEQCKRLEHEEAGKNKVTVASHFLKLYGIRLLLSKSLDNISDAVISWNFWLALVRLKRLLI